MENKIYFDCKIDIDIPQLELRASSAYYLFHEHTIVYPEEDKGKVSKVTGELQFYSNNGSKDIISRLYFSKIEDLDDLILILSNMKKDWETQDTR